MATFRDDLVRAGRRIREAVEERTGREIVARDEMQVLEADALEGRGTRKLWDYMWQRIAASQQGQGSMLGSGAMPKDVTPTMRIASAAQAERAWRDDPMAGQMVDLYVSFVFGRGVPRPRARDSDVQEILDATWDDDANRRVLTSFSKLVEKGIDLSLQSNVYWRLFDDGEDGKVRLSLVTFEDVQDVVRHEHDKYRITYYRAVERPVIYDFRTGRSSSPHGPAGDARTVYYEAWGAFDPDNPVMVAQDKLCVGPLGPPESMLRTGKIVHLAVNKRSEMAFGVPRMNRLTRWWKAYNDVLEAHVNRMKAAASILMTQTVDGNARDLDRVAAQTMGRAPRFGEARQDRVVENAGQGTTPGTVQNGVIQQNAGVKHDAFKIDSGAGDVAQSVPELRAQGSGIFPPTYYGQDAGALAGSQAVELPVLKFIERDQEAWADVFRALGTAAVRAAVRVGTLSEWRNPTAREIEALAYAEETGEPSGIETDENGQVRRDLGFDVSLPSPLKRAMGDLVTAAVATASAVDPTGERPEMSRWLFGFILAQAFDVEDPEKVVDQVLPRTPTPVEEEEEPDAAPGRPTAPDGTETITGQDGRQHSSDNPGGAPVETPNPEDRPVRETLAPDVPDADQAAAAVEDAFDAMVIRNAEALLATIDEDG